MRRTNYNRSTRRTNYRRTTVRKTTVIKKPTMRSSWNGVRGNKWRTYNVTVDGKVYHHQSKTSALRQFNAAKRLYKKKKRIK